MSFQSSPGVITTEVDRTNTLQPNATTVGAFAGHFNWGPVDEVVTVGSEKELADAYGSPSNGVNTVSFLTAAAYLKYSNSLRVSRALGDTARNASDLGSVLIRNKDQFDSISDINFTFAAKYPGALGNSIQVFFAHVSGQSLSEYNNWKYRPLFDAAPQKSATMEAARGDTNDGNNDGNNDEINLVVVDTGGLITGTKGTILEKYERLSLGSNAKTLDGLSIYYKDVINTSSSYIYVGTLSNYISGADQVITESSVFTTNTVVSPNSYADLPFSIVTQTSVAVGDGDPVITETTDNITIRANSGINGDNGNNVKFNFRKVATADAPAVAAHGYILYGIPGDDATVTVATSTFTKVAADPGVGEFTNITELTALIDNIASVSATALNDNVIIITATTAGTAGNSIVLSATTTEEDELPITVSGSTLVGGFAALSTAYADVSIMQLDPINGHIVYTVDLAVDADNDVNTTSGTLKTLIQKIRHQTLIAGLENDVAFLLNGTTITESNQISAAVIRAESLFPYEADNDTAVVVFVGGSSLAFSNATFTPTFTLTNGTIGTQNATNITSALSLFEDKDLIDIDFVFAEVFEDTLQQATVDIAVIDLAERRADVLAAIPAPISLYKLQNNTSKKAALLTKFNSVRSSSYVTFGSSPLYTYNKYNDTYVWIPDNAHMCGLCANTDRVADAWFSPAGLNRGQLRGVIKLAYNPNQTDRDDLYKARINPIISLPGEGIILFGDKTALSKPSAFDRINVRRLFNVLKRTVSNATRYQLFEFNDEFTRAAFVNSVEPFLRDVQGRRGISDGRVVCDASNNTPEVIDTNRFVGQIFVKPNRAINFAELQFIATRTGVEFTEIAG